jgi:hypothetical protein
VALARRGGVVDLRLDVFHRVAVPGVRAADIPVGAGGKEGERGKKGMSWGAGLSETCTCIASGGWVGG